MYLTAFAAANPSRAVDLPTSLVSRILTAVHARKDKSRINRGAVIAIAGVCGVVVAVLAGVGVFSGSSGRVGTNTGYSPGRDARAGGTNTGNTTTTKTTALSPSTTTKILPVGTCRGTWSYANGKVNASVLTRGPATVNFGAADSQGDQVSASEKVAAGSTTESATMDIARMPNLVTAYVVELSAEGSPTGVSAKCNLTRTDGLG